MPDYAQRPTEPEPDYTDYNQPSTLDAGLAFLLMLGFLGLFAVLTGTACYVALRWWVS